MSSKLSNRRLNRIKLITLIDPKSPITEAFRTLRTNIQFSSIDKPINSIMITSTAPSEGKSTTAANLGVVLSQTDKKILLVDADLRMPTVHTTFQLPNRQGLSKVLAGSNQLLEAIQENVLPGLDILSSGPIPPNPAELLGSKKMVALMEEMTSTYDTVVFDTPPVLSATDAQILARIVDGVILVINSGKTTRDMAIKGKSLLDNVKANVIGTVLNNRNQKSEGYYYYYQD